MQGRLHSGRCALPGSSGCVYIKHSQTLRRPFLTPLPHRTLRQCSRQGVSGPRAAAVQSIGQFHVPRPQLPSWLQSKHDSELWRLAIPALLGSILDPIMTAIDTSIAGHLGTAALTGASVGAQVATLAPFFFSFLMVLTVPEVAGAHGKGDNEKVRRVLAQSLWLALLLGAVATAVCWFSTPALVAGQVKDAAIAANAVAYARWRNVATFFVVLNNIGLAANQGLQDTMSNLQASIAAAATNFTLNFVFVYGLGMGVGGIALATSMSHIVASAMLFVPLLRKGVISAGAMFRPQNIMDMLRTLRKGIVVAIRTLAFQAILMSSNKVLAAAGAVELGVYVVTRQVWVLMFVASTCFRVASSALIGKSLGKGDAQTAVEVSKRGMLFGALCSTLAVLPMCFAPHIVGSLFTRDAAIISRLTPCFVFFAVTAGMDGVHSVLDGTQIAIRQSDFASAVIIVCSMLGLGGMQMLFQHMQPTALSVLMAQKATFMVIPMAAAVWRVFFWKHSPLRLQRKPAATQLQHAAHVSDNNGTDAAIAATPSASDAAVFGSGTQAPPSMLQQNSSLYASLTDSQSRSTQPACSSTNGSRSSGSQSSNGNGFHAETDVLQQRRQ